MQIVQIHLHKTAGTALFDSLRRHFEPTTSYWGSNPVFDDPKLQLAASHLPFRDHVFVDTRKRMLITSIRDPFERVISLYRYWRSMRWTMVARSPLPAITKAKQMDLAAWLRDPEVKPIIDNGTVAHFCDDIEAPAETRLEQAKTNIGKMHFIFATQTLADDMEQFLDALSLDSIPPEIINATNANPDIHPDTFERIDQVEVDDEAFEALSECTKLDRELYDHILAIRDEINQRLKSVVALTPPQIKLRRLADGTSLLARGLRTEPVVLGQGWAPSEDWHVWSTQSTANLLFETTPDVRTVELKLQAHLTSGRELLKLRIVINNTSMMQVLFVGGSAVTLLDCQQGDDPLLLCSGASPVLIQAPVEIGRSPEGRVDVRFEIEDLQSPAQLGLSDDVRLLGIALYSLRSLASPAPDSGHWRRLDNRTR